MVAFKRILDFIKKIYNLTIRMIKRVPNSLDTLFRYLLVVLFFITVARTVSTILQIIPYEFSDWWSAGLTSGIYFVSFKEGIVDNMSYKSILLWIFLMVFIHLILKSVEENLLQREDG